MSRAAIVPLAGNSSRFSKFTSRPKWALKLGGRSVLDWALVSLMEQTLEIDQFVFVIKSTQIEEFRGALSTLPRARYDLVEVSETPNGQADSVAIGLRSNYFSGEFLVWNGDTHLSEGWSEDLALTGNWLVLSELVGSHWSFASVVGNLVTQTVEKRRISSTASVGLYSFSSPDEFLEAYEEAPKAAEVYVAPLYNSIISRGGQVRPFIIPKETFHPLGTPEEVILTSKRFGLSAPQELLSGDSIAEGS